VDCLRDYRMEPFNFGGFEQFPPKYHYCPRSPNTRLQPTPAKNTPTRKPIAPVNHRRSLLGGQRRGGRLWLRISERTLKCSFRIPAKIASINRRRPSAPRSRILRIGKPPILIARGDRLSRRPALARVHKFGLTLELVRLRSGGRWADEILREIERSK
jgi:hypothetical protein